MRFLATGDIQAHNWRQFSYVRSDGQNSRLHNCLKVFDILEEEARARRIRRVLLNGDIFEENAYIDVEVYDAVYRRLERLHSEGLDIVVNVGNHDVLLQSGGRVLHSLRPLRKICKVIESPTLVWGKLWVVPWMAEPEKFKQTIKHLRVKGSMSLVCHVGV